MYVLHHFPYSQHARRVVSLMEEADLPYELCHVAMDENEHLAPAYLRINPNHQVPTLVDGDFKLHESNAILRYLCDKHKLASWYPEEPQARALVNQWLDWNQCRLAPVVVDIVLNKVFLGNDGDQAAIRQGEEVLAALADILDATLEGQDYLVGNQPTIADLSVASNIFQLGIADATPQASNISRWFANIANLKGFQKSLPQG